MAARETPASVMTALAGFGAALGVLILALASAYVLERRPDLPYAVLEARYGSPQDRTLALSDGVRLNYRDEGAPNGPPLILIHGYSASAADWNAWAERLGDTYRIIAIDLPGHGLTRTPKGYHASVDGYVEAVNALVGHLDLGRFILVGSSLGGETAWRFALAHPQQLRGLVLVGAAGWPLPEPKGAESVLYAALKLPAARSLAQSIDDRAMIRDGLKAAFENPALVTPALIDRYTDLSRAPGHRAILLSLDDDGVTATTARLSAIAAPTLVMAGTKDRLIPASDARRFAAAIPGAMLVLYKDIGHLPMEEIPDRSASDLRAWLATLPP